MYEDVLIATDGSDIATDAAAVGISIAQALDATVHVLSVADKARDNDTKHEKAADAVVADAVEAGCVADSVVRTGRPATEILAYADEAAVDAIVVGTHGRTGLRQALLGSVALEVIRDARRPVLTVGRETIDSSDVRIDDVCLATDGSAGSTAATAHALSLAEACDATLHALYAVDVRADADEIRQNFLEHGETTTAAIETRASDRGLETRRTVTEGEAHDAILDYVDAESVDVLVMGTESKSNLERLVLGSVSQRVVPAASVPVMTVRTAEE
ncbi:universal stress protein [Natronorubrum sulfidifaciens]|uniref:UspA domain-containing protein n=1 Tax=Natronorubrum sulfidifaciens JCM 14089 TaxID=1230460 RepID=L9W5R1_9EURY|nr:universal stress protein [Natronorubrum sulfidifaciens]ELY44606.1 UspA domain-containing protein [Natronorubrum sulfidifaciens JCM 14089]